MKSWVRVRRLSSAIFYVIAFPCIFPVHFPLSNSETARVTAQFTRLQVPGGHFHWTALSIALTACLVASHLSPILPPSLPPSIPTCIYTYP